MWFTKSQFKRATTSATAYSSLAVCAPSMLFLINTGERTPSSFIAGIGPPAREIFDRAAVPSLLSETLLRSILFDLVAFLALTWFACGLLKVMRRMAANMRAGRVAAGIHTAAGVSVIEFILLLPLLLAVLLMILQIALIVQAKFVVNYAAFCAARSAVVTIPARIRSSRTGIMEKRNVIYSGNPDSPKLNIIWRAAALPCAAVSPVWSLGLIPATGTASAESRRLSLALVAVALSESVDGFSLGEQFLKRAPYSFDKNNTKVEILSASGRSGQAPFGEHDLVTVRVSFRYYLGIPFANRLFGTPYEGGGWFGQSAWYLLVTEQYTMPIEGERTFPEHQEPADDSGIVETEEFS